jgi:hypothetical protein
MLASYYRPTDGVPTSDATVSGGIFDERIGAEPVGRSMSSSSLPRMPVTATLNWIILSRRTVV